MRKRLAYYVMTKFIFVTGGVVSSLGKGIAAASLAAILESRGITISMVKLDPYLNVDPGTMSPFQHGEVFVTEDGAETDLDLGHYERFVSTKMSKRTPSPPADYKRDPQGAPGRITRGTLQVSRTARESSRIRRGAGDADIAMVD